MQGNLHRAVRLPSGGLFVSMDWSKLIGDKAMEVAELYETAHGRVTNRVHQQGVGYDLRSSGNEERYIEVKGVSESWKTYTWQPLHHTEVETLKRQSAHYFLYIVRFEISKENRDQEHLNSAPYQLFVLPGEKLLNNFKIVPQSFALTPISKRRLLPFSVEKPVVDLMGENL